MKSKKNILLFMTSGFMLKFLLPHVKILSAHYNVNIILKNDYPEVIKSLSHQVKIIELNINRKISIFADLFSLIKLIIILKKNRFDCIHTFTPKAGLIGIIAAYLTMIPVRIHTFQGEVWSNKKGIFRFILKYCDKVISILSTHVTVVSFSERKFLISENVLNEEKSFVICDGSIGGVNLSQFKTNEVYRNKFRSENNFKNDDLVFIYLGRINPDKGLAILARAFSKLNEINKKVNLIYVGPDEENEKKNIIENLNYNSIKSVKFFPFTMTPEKIINGCDILVLPSFREGFGVVIIEAAAIGLPSIGSNIYGIQDAIKTNKSGLLFQSGNVQDLFEKMYILSHKPKLRSELGDFAKKRAIEKFSQKIILNKFLGFYLKVLN